jgi:hypothetical protein
MAFMFVCDEYTDKVDNDGAHAYAEIVMDALRNPHKERPKGESNLGEIARRSAYISYVPLACAIDNDLGRFSLQAIEVASTSSWKRFIAAFDEYFNSVINEAADRAAGHIRNIADYLRLRRLTIGGYPSYLCLELGLDLPDEVMEHPGMKSLLGLVADTILLTNVSNLHPHEYTHLTKTIGYVLVQR